MGRKKNCLITILLFSSLFISAQQRDYRYYDSLTFAEYQAGDLKNMISAGEEALSIGIDYKYLRQRLGHAYFLEKNYYKAGQHFRKALFHDSADQFTLEYMYWSLLNSGRQVYAGTLYKPMFPDLRERLGIKKFMVVESLEAEMGLKSPESDYRSEAVYTRIGAATAIGYRMRLFQSIANYNQSVNFGLSDDSSFVKIRQPEYFALLTWNISKRLILRTSYHRMNTHSGILTFTGNTFLVGVAPDLDRLILDLTGSVTYYASERISQARFTAGYNLPGRAGFFIRSSAAPLFTPDDYNIVFSQRAGFKVSGNAWIDGWLDFGRMNYYNDFDGLYIYNSFDPMISRKGISFTWYINKSVTLWLSGSLEEKEINGNNFVRYNQYSYLGGLRWKM